MDEEEGENDPLGLFDEVNGGLTMKQRMFAQAYVDNGGHGTNAAITAGYPEDHAASRASENVRNRKIIDEIGRRYELRTNASGATADYAISALKDNLEAAKQENRFSDVNKAAELIGKYHKLFTDRMEHMGAVSIAATNSDMSLDEAIRIYEDNLKGLRE